MFLYSGFILLKKITFAFLLLFLTYILLFLAFVGYVFLPSAQPTKKHDAVIVLTGGAGRISSGLEIYNQKLADKIFISGVHRSVEPEHLDALNQIPQDLQGIIAKDDLGYEATNTIENAQESGSWMKKNNIRSIYLVTADFHILRSYMEFKKVAPHIYIQAVPVKTFLTCNAYAVRRLWMEFGKVMYRFLKMVMTF
ncbi:MAG: hypothetical protein C0432_05960 [Candidatus Puniceispirillum sp.]|nr:hypothetical protein [Candidatus Pelagibacter sp.]MBA4283819.1 hypothetical protein [Candidatus Puniceispirillum sp.]